MESVIHPRGQGKIYGFCDVEPSVESLVVSSGSGYDEFPFSLDSAMELDPLRQQIVRIDQRGLVPYVLGTGAELFAKVTLHVLLERLVVVEVDRVPELGLATVQVVDTVEVAVLLVPAEHGLPRAQIQVGRRDSRDRLLIEALTTYKVALLITSGLRWGGGGNSLEEGLDLSQVPRHTLVKYRA